MRLPTLEIVKGGTWRSEHSDHCGVGRGRGLQQLREPTRPGRHERCRERRHRRRYQLLRHRRHLRRDQVRRDARGRARCKWRDDFVIATKFGMPIDDTHFGASPAYVRAACEDSLRRLGTDHIDLYQLHYPDDTVPIAETIGALHELIEQGKVREIGCSNFTVAQLREAKSAAGDGPSFVSVQNQYSLLERGPERDGVLDTCGELAIGLSALLSPRQRTAHRKGPPGPTAAGELSPRQDGARAKRALAGRRTAGQGRRAARLRRRDRGADPVAGVLVAAQPRRRSRA